MLIIKDLNKIYSNDNRAISNISPLPIDYGVCVFLGSNRAIKSSWIYILAILQGADSDEIKVNNTDILKHPQ